jgi:Phytanoyl-CoA dioxygenase (PhyH)
VACLAAVDRFPPGGEALTVTVESVLTDLERDGIAVLPGFLTQAQIAAMRAAFESRLRHLRWSDVDGYEQTEPYRHMVQDVLTLEQGFVDVALHPLVKQTLGDYLGSRFELVEAKGWKSLPTRRDFHGWHGDAWYNQSEVVSYIPREVKLAFYLTDVRSGFFEYIKGSHGKWPPRLVKGAELASVPRSQILEVKGTAGTAFLFDTTGIHRQSVPILEPRYAVFYNYHDPAIPLQQEDLDYYRYHPLILNAAFLGGLSEEDREILGFGNKTNYVAAFERRSRHRSMQNAFEAIFRYKLHWEQFWVRMQNRVKRPKA